MPAQSLTAFLGAKSTLYLTARRRDIHLRGQSLVLDDDQLVPLASLRRVVLLGKPLVPLAVLYRCMRLKLPVDWLDIYGEPLGQLMGMAQSAPFLMENQAAFCSGPGAFLLAKAMLLAKFDNCREALRRRLQSRPDWREKRMGLVHASLPDSLRGHEGACAHFYFSLWSGILHGFSWHGRHARPAPDPVNMLLSLGYGLLRNRLASALAHYGLNPRRGFFHAPGGRHAALASDLMEPLRALVDSRVLSLLRRHELAPEDFRMSGGRCVCANGEVFGRIIGNFEDMFAATHSFYPFPDQPRFKVKRSLNDLLDDLSESFALHCHDGQGCLVPRLAPCPAT